eukprot:SM000042S15326  [mRNA]  locus=s42:384496:384780:- [translate_table: standard]
MQPPAFMASQHFKQLALMTLRPAAAVCQPRKASISPSLRTRPTCRRPCSVASCGVSAAECLEALLCCLLSSIPRSDHSQSCPRCAEDCTIRGSK